MTERSRAFDSSNTFHLDRSNVDSNIVCDDGLPTDVDSSIALRAAQSNCTLLITGETGVGKGHMARWVHENSPRRNGPFIPVNCGAIPETLVDSQLFGHTKGAFSGASNDHVGLVRAAQLGTLLLDEVSELPPPAQVRLLRLLQEREVQPVGLSRPIVVDVRVIAATNVDLKQAVEERRFREDLLFRLDVVQLTVPPLRKRLHELPQLLANFNDELAELYRQPTLQFEDDAMATLHQYHWPGNIRQLRSLLERLHVLCPGATISTRHIAEVGQLPQPTPFEPNSIEQMKKEYLQSALHEAGGSVAEAARMFGVHRSTIYRWLQG